MKKNLLKPLKKILTSLTGEETEDKNIIAVVDKIADAVENNESSSSSIKSNISITKIWETTVTTVNGQDAFGGSAKLIGNKSMRYYIANNRSNAQIAADGIDTLSKVLNFHIVTRLGSTSNDTWYNTEIYGASDINVKIQGIADPVVEPLQTLDVDTLYYSGTCSGTGAKKFKIEIYLICAD